MELTFFKTKSVSIAEIFCAIGETYTSEVMLSNGKIRKNNWNNGEVDFGVYCAITQLKQLRCCHAESHRVFVGEFDVYHIPTLVRVRLGIDRNYIVVHHSVTGVEVYTSVMFPMLTPEMANKRKARFQARRAPVQRMRPRAFQLLNNASEARKDGQKVSCRHWLELHRNWRKRLANEGGANDGFI